MLQCMNIVSPELTTGDSRDNYFSRQPSNSQAQRCVEMRNYFLPIDVTSRVYNKTSGKFFLHTWEKDLNKTTDMYYWNDQWCNEQNPVICLEQ